MDERNKLGERIILQLPKGIILCVVWVDTKLSNLDVIFGEDGFSVKMKTRMPNPANASELLSHYGGWSSDSENVAVSALDELLVGLKGDQPADKWEETEIVSADEELFKAFVDIKGRPLINGNIGHKTDQDGRQHITFFLKTLRSHQAQHAAPKGCFGNNSAGPSGMDIGGDNASDHDSFEETIDDIKADIDDRFNDMTRRMQEDNEVMQNQMRSMMSAMNDMSNFMQQQHQHAQAQAQAQAQAEAQKAQQQPQQVQSGFIYEGAAAPDNVGS